MPNKELNFEELVGLLTSAVQRNVLGKTTDTFSLPHIADFAASIDSAQYYVEKMQKATHYDDKMKHIAGAVALAPADGLVLEFGVNTGTTVNHIADLMPQRAIHGFDVFYTGLPEEWRPGFDAGKFARTELPAVRKNVELVVGLFEDTLPGFLDGHPGPLAFLNVDCDLYSSTKTVFRYLAHRIVKGTIILFDEYLNYPGWRSHEFKAFQEYIAWSGQSYEYVSLVYTHQQVVVRITS
jgi:Macrocin-O-methyltransferase (TylF)